MKGVGLRDGTILHGQFDILKVIGYGNTSMVYLAEDSQLSDETVVIKEFFPQSFANRDLDQMTLVLKNGISKEKIQCLQQAFIQEYEVLRHLDKENNSPPGMFPKALDFFFENETSYLVMEYIEGESLKDILALEPVADKNRAEEQILQYLPGIIKAVQVLHKNRIIHRDIKPDNIRIHNDNSIAIIDFGSACYDRQQAFLNWVSEGYSAPELYMDNFVANDAIDSYSLGAVMYEIVTRYKPFSARMRCKGDRMLGNDVAIENSLRELINGLLEYDPDKREKYKKILEERYFEEITC